MGNYWRMSGREYLRRKEKTFWYALIVHVIKRQGKGFSLSRESQNGNKTFLFPFLNQVTWNVISIMEKKREKRTVAMSFARGFFVFSREISRTPSKYLRALNVETNNDFSYTFFKPFFHSIIYVHPQQKNAQIKTLQGKIIITSLFFLIVSQIYLKEKKWENMIE